MSQSPESQNQNGYLQNADEEISLLDILLCLKRAWKTIVIMSVLGVLIAGIFLVITPNQYEALVNISMGRIPAEKNPLGINIEEPQALINRMSLPSSLDASAISACGLQDTSNLAVQLSKVIKLSIPKGVAGVVELKVNRPTPELAQNCANSVFETIAKSQAQIGQEFTQKQQAQNQARLKVVENRLTQDKNLLAKAEQGKGNSSGGLTPTYFALLTEIRALEDEQQRLLEATQNNESGTAQLQSPVYVATQPVFPKKALSLLAGLLGGLFLGLVLALVRQIITKLKSEMQALA